MPEKWIAQPTLARVQLAQRTGARERRALAFLRAVCPPGVLGALRVDRDREVAVRALSLRTNASVDVLTGSAVVPATGAEGRKRTSPRRVRRRACPRARPASISEPWFGNVSRA
jgi:hypothetical protein